MSKKPTVLMILDGYGLNSKDSGNAVAQAKTPVMDKLMAECPFVKGNASGMAVGLPDGQMGMGKRNPGALWEIRHPGFPTIIQTRYRQTHLKHF